MANGKEEPMTNKRVAHSKEQKAKALVRDARRKAKAAEVVAHVKGARGDDVDPETATADELDDFLDAVHTRFVVGRTPLADRLLDMFTALENAANSALNELTARSLRLHGSDATTEPELTAIARKLASLTAFAAHVVQHSRHVQAASTSAKSTTPASTSDAKEVKP